MSHDELRTVIRAELNAYGNWRGGWSIDFRAAGTWPLLSWYKTKNTCILHLPGDWEERVLRQGLIRIWAPGSGSYFCGHAEPLPRETFLEGVWVTHLLLPTAEGQVFWQRWLTGRLGGVTRAVRWHGKKRERKISLLNLEMQIDQAIKIQLGV